LWTKLADIAVSELKDVIIVLQSHLITVLRRSVESESRRKVKWLRLRNTNQQDGVTTDTLRLAEISDNARLNAISTLAALYQRFAPIPHSVPETAITTSNTTINQPPLTQPITYQRPASFFCEGARLLQEHRKLGRENISKPYWDQDMSESVMACNYCNGILWPDGCFPQVRSTSRKINRRFANKSHAPWRAEYKSFVDFGCIFCDSNELFNLLELESHLTNFHTDSDFREELDLLKWRNW